MDCVFGSSQHDILLEEKLPKEEKDKKHVSFESEQNL